MFRQEGYEIKLKEQIEKLKDGNARAMNGNS
jgi:hypothetical protein